MRRSLHASTLRQLHTVVVCRCSCCLSVVSPSRSALSCFDSATYNPAQQRSQSRRKTAANERQRQRAQKRKQTPGGAEDAGDEEEKQTLRRVKQKAATSAASAAGSSGHSSAAALLPPIASILDLHDHAVFSIFSFLEFARELRPVCAASGSRRCCASLLCPVHIP